MTDSWPAIWEALPKAMLYAAVQLAVGVAAAHWLSRGPSGEGHPASIDRRLAQLAGWVAALTLAALAFRAVGHSVTVFGPVEGLRLDSLQTIAVESRWGRAWQFQVLAALFLLSAAGCVRVRPAAGWALFLVAALACCGSLPLLGHAAGSVWRVAIHGMHVAASGAWVGTLGILVVLTLRARGTETSSTLATMVARFSGIALPAAAVLFATGLVTTVVYLGAVTHLWDTAYGRTLLIKVFAVAGVVACGWRNWRRSRAGAPVSAALMALELTVAASAVVTTSVLTELEHP